jgi:arylamine N-acetyltransferase
MGMAGPIYEPEQMQQYFDRIRLPERWRRHPICAETRLPGTLKDDQALEVLEVLQACQLSTVPFESISLHYSSHHSISIDKDDVFQKIVSKGSGRGGYCMENNVLFLTVMNTLGYKVYPTGGRVNTAVQLDPTRGSGKDHRYMGW